MKADIQFLLATFTRCILARQSRILHDFRFFIFIKSMRHSSELKIAARENADYNFYPTQFRRIFWITRRVQIWWWEKAATSRCVAKQQGRQSQTSPGGGKTASWLSSGTVRKVNYLQSVVRVQSLILYNLIKWQWNDVLWDGMRLCKYRSWRHAILRFSYNYNLPLSLERERERYPVKFRIEVRSDSTISPSLPIYSFEFLSIQRVTDNFP